MVGRAIENKDKVLRDPIITEDIQAQAPLIKELIKQRKVQPKPVGFNYQRLPPPELLGRPPPPPLPPSRGVALLTLIMRPIHSTS